MVWTLERGQPAVTQPNEKQVRSFIAIPVPDEGIRALKQVVADFDPEIGRYVRWVRPEGIHLTIKFMGNIPAGIVERVLGVLPLLTANLSPFSIQISGLGGFPNLRKPRVLWAGLDGDLGALRALQLEVDGAMADIGLPKEQRLFSPHLTLARVRREVSDGQLRKISEVVASGEIFATPAWTVNTISLMRTELDPAGSRHYLVGAASIGG